MYLYTTFLYSYIPVEPLHKGHAGAVFRSVLCSKNTRKYWYWIETSVLYRKVSFLSVLYRIPHSWFLTLPSLTHPSPAFSSSRIHRSMYHSLANSTILFLQAVFSMEQVLCVVYLFLAPKPCRSCYVLYVHAGCNREGTTSIEWYSGPLQQVRVCV